MIRRHLLVTWTATLFPYTTFFRSKVGKKKVVRPEPVEGPFFSSAIAERKDGASTSSARTGKYGSRSVLRLVHQLVLGDPRHHRAQFGAGLFELMRGGGLAAGLQLGLAGLVVDRKSQRLNSSPYCASRMPAS